MIVNSTFQMGHLQKDGRRYVVERHVDSIGAVHVREYLAGQDADHQAIMDSAAVVISDLLGHAELMTALASDGPIVAQQQTLNQLAQRLRAYYQSSQRDECARVAAWIVVRLEAGTLTDTQMRNVFGLTAGQWTTLRAKLVTLRDHHNAVDAARGE